jgi:hypothetical protein
MRVGVVVCMCKCANVCISVTHKQSYGRTRCVYICVRVCVCVLFGLGATDNAGENCGVHMQMRVCRLVYSYKHTYAGLARTVCTYIYDVYDRIFVDFPAKNTVYIHHRMYGSGQIETHAMISPYGGQFS